MSLNVAPASTESPSNKFQILLWNIEGYQNVNKTSPETDIFKDSDFVFLTEALVCEEIVMRGYVTFMSNAKKNTNKDRPSGGLLAAVKPHFNPTLLKKTENFIIVNTNVAIFINCYYNPTFKMY